MRFTPSPKEGVSFSARGPLHGSTQVLVGCHIAVCLFASTLCNILDIFSIVFYCFCLFGWSMLWLLMIWCKLFLLLINGCYFVCMSVFSTIVARKVRGQLFLWHISCCEYSNLSFVLLFVFSRCEIVVIFLCAVWRCARKVVVAHARPFGPQR
jgi:hypothetical protein